MIATQSMAMGAHGGVAGGSNLFPRLFANLYNAAREGDFARVRFLEPLVFLIDNIYRVGLGTSSPSGAYLKGMKAGLHALGVCGAPMSFPFDPLPPESTAAIAKLVDQIKASGVA